MAARMETSPGLRLLHPLRFCIEGRFWDAFLLTTATKSVCLNGYTDPPPPGDQNLMHAVIITWSSWYRAISSLISTLLLFKRRASVFTKFIPVQGVALIKDMRAFCSKQKQKFGCITIKTGSFSHYNITWKVYGRGVQAKPPGASVGTGSWDDLSISN